MITYLGDSFGVNILFRVHGSAVYKSLTPTILASAVYVILYEVVELSYDEDPPLFLHPYPINALVTAYTFLLVFRANYSYSRWWEAYSNVYGMHSKWLDFATSVTSFHLQSVRYDAQRPPAFGAYPEVRSLGQGSSNNNAGSGLGGTGVPSYELSRHHHSNASHNHQRHATVEDLIAQIDALEEEERQNWEDGGIGDSSGRPPSFRSRFRTFRRRQKGRTIAKMLERRRKEDTRQEEQRRSSRLSPRHPASSSNHGQQQSKSISRPANRLHETVLFEDRFDLKTGTPNSIFTAVTRKHLREGGLDPDETPPLLFLEECAHLLSLMSAVAFSTLRNDLPNAESPLADFQPGLPWPHVDPDMYRGEYRKGGPEASIGGTP